ncbi:hypothetical protein RCOM_1323670 [Ricinus communis]|uniref:Uncharacterized protein n=1 Tax=Ricinus communis TaxID=3988 RepID=B9S1X6_RICCO|nr:hypothetical protein RCOM_1323670 [Ricinus communis]
MIMIERLSCGHYGPFGDTRVKRLKSIGIIDAVPGMKALNMNTAEGAITGLTREIVPENDCYRRQLTWLSSHWGCIMLFMEPALLTLEIFLAAAESSKMVNASMAIPTAGTNTLNDEISDK